jgi:hypothetical protein
MSFKDLQKPQQMLCLCTISCECGWVAALLEGEKIILIISIKKIISWKKCY